MGKQQALVIFSALLIVFWLFLASANAAIIYGKVYSWETLEPVKGAIVEINTTPAQKKVAENGSYVFEVPPGHYKLEAYYVSGGSELYDEENITVVEEGRYVIDLVLFPRLEYPQIKDINKVNFSVDEEGGSDFHVYALSLLAVFSVFVLILLVWRIRSRGKGMKDERTVIEFKDDKIADLPEDLKEVFEILVREGGRISQRELRKKLGYSEAKISLMVADLERRGVIEKVKKGRGNIIFLRDEYLK